jgi:spoIIIJ-associated protein
MEQNESSAKVLTDEDLDTIADTAISIIQDILFYFNVGNITIDEYDGEDSELILDITGDDLAVLIGRHGKTLEALQTIVSAVLLQKIGYKYPVVVDVEGYKSRQRDKLESIAKSAASRAVKQNKNVHLNPMSPYERRIIHIALSSNNKVSTQSEGEGAKRHVVISPL